LSFFILVVVPINLLIPLEAVRLVRVPLEEVLQEPRGRFAQLEQKVHLQGQLVGLVQQQV
jgi:hypothetical protein